MCNRSSQLLGSVFALNRALLVFALAATIGIATTVSASEDSTVLPAPQEVKPQLPPEKQTALGLYVTAREAYERWKAAPQKVKIIDVRTPEEFIFIGHADMAWNIAIATQTYQWDADKKHFKMQPLPDFVSRVKKVAKPDDTLLVMCRSGGRSALAVNALGQAGLKNVYNIIDGMEGDVVNDPESVFRDQRLVNGWKNSGLPWTYHIDPERMVLPPDR
jgi:rhodanese-related sulfurtransferase